MAFDMIAGLSGWMVTKDEILSAIATGTITYAKSIGEAMAKYDGNGNIYDFIAIETSVCRRNIPGAPSPEQTKTALKNGKRRLEEI